MNGQGFLYHVVGLPDGAEAGSLGGHHVDSAAVVHGKGGNAGAEELHDGILHGTGGERLFNDAQGHILRADTGTGLAGEINAHHLGQVNVIGPAKQLLDQLGAALANGHGAVCAVAGVRVGTDDHLSAAGIPLPHIGVNDRLMGRDKLAAVLLGSGQAEHVVVLVDGAAHCAQAVMTVRQHIGQRKFLQAAGPGRLDDADVSNIMGCHGVELHFQVLHIAAEIVCGHNAIGHGLGAACFRTVACLNTLLCRDGSAALIVTAFVPNRNHEKSS